MEYKELEKKYGLPKQQQLEILFDIEIKESKYLSKDILKKIEEKLEYLCDKIQNTLHSDSNLESFYECNFLDEKEKEKLFEIFKEFMGKRKEIISRTIGFSEKENCKLIISCHSLFSSHKTKLEETFLKIGKKWVEKDNPRKEAARYFG